MTRTAFGWVLTVCLVAFWSLMAAAQTTTPDYLAWEKVAQRAEAAVEVSQASDGAFDALRAEVADWRQQFQTQLSANDSRLDTLREQIASLGPLPAEGTTEAPELAARRAELDSQLERMITPRRTAEEAFSRANGVIAEIDGILRDRQAQELLDRGPLPINPANWPTAYRHIGDTVSETIGGAQSAIENPIRLAAAQNNLPVIILLFVVGIILLVRSRKWSELLADRVQLGASDATGGIAGFLVSLGQILLPMLGLWALIRAIGATEMFGPRGQLLLDALEPVGLVLLFSLWLAGRFFPKGNIVRSPLPLPSKRRTEGRIYTCFLGIVWGLALLLERFSEYESYAPAASAVLHFILICVASLLIIRLGWLVRRAVRGAEEDKAVERAFARRFVQVTGQGAIAIGLIAPLLAALGYNTAARTLIYPAMATFALFALISLLQNLLRDIYAAIRPGEDARDSLIPTLLSFGIAIMSLPLLALIWGARVTDLTEVLGMVQSGLTIGDTTISPGSFFTLIIVFMLGYLLTRAIQNALKVSVLPKTRIEPGGQVAMVSGLGYIGIFLSALFAITTAGIDLSSLAIVAGALSVGIGFGLQTIVSNFVSGIILLIERPIAEGDWIEVGGQMGYVRSISVRSTRIETFDRTDVIVPNADLISGTVTNYTRGNTVGRLILPVGVAYGTDTRRVDRILRELAEAHPMTLMNPPPTILFAGFGADSLDFEIRVILRDVNWMNAVKNDLNHQIAERFVAEGIEIPFAQRDVWLRNPEALQQRPSAKPSPMPQEAPQTGVQDIDPSAAPDAEGDGR
ncbi:MAG: DUF3772 domain-containing protein [Tateyamaria sp.]|uniref:DUF3772 domain-containing protein n=1 Tax=Tateyamaria sp. TaxID=1929288 RepID=UPI00329CB1B7